MREEYRRCTTPLRCMETAPSNVNCPISGPRQTVARASYPTPSRDDLSLCSAATHLPRRRSPFLTSGEGACTAWRQKSAGVHTEAARRRNLTISFRVPPRAKRIAGILALGAALNHGDG